MTAIILLCAGLLVGASVGAVAMALFGIAGREDRKEKSAPLRRADSAVTLAAKSHLRNGRPLVLAVSTNDGLAGAAKNIGALLNYKNVFFVPMRQDDFAAKPTSIVAEFDYISQTLYHALEKKQIQPVYLPAIPRAEP